VKSFGFLLAHLSTATARRNLRIVGWLLVVLGLVVAAYSALFESEDRTFAVLVLLTGSVLVFVLLPLTFIQFVSLPWMESSQRSRVSRDVKPDVEGHVLLTGAGAIERALINRLVRAGIPYAALVGDVDEALKLQDEGIEVVVGALDDPETYRAAGAERAVLVAATQADTTNTNIAFTVQEISASVVVVATAKTEASEDILRLAGCDQVLRLDEMLGVALARRVLAPDGRSRVIGELGELLIAEAVAPEKLVGRALRQSDIRARTGLTVGGIWDRGRLDVARPDTMLHQSSTLVLAGSRAQLDVYDELFANEQTIDGPVLIIGGGRVGRAAGRALTAAGLDFRIIEQRPELIQDPEHLVEGDAADLAVLEQAGFDGSSAVMITTHDDDLNVYLAIFCRRLRSDVQIIARANLDRNVSTLHRAGADSVLSYASIAANAIWNELTADNTLQLAEGLDVFRVPMPVELVGKTLGRSQIREWTGCTVVAIADGEGFRSNPDAGVPFPAGADLVLIGDGQSEDRFLRRYRSGRR
jgi:Trk K+ transport system NAD-binding subunit